MRVDVALGKKTEHPDRVSQRRGRGALLCGLVLVAASTGCAALSGLSNLEESDCVGAQCVDASLDADASVSEVTVDSAHDTTITLESSVDSQADTGAGETIAETQIDSAVDETSDADVSFVDTSVDTSVDSSVDSVVDSGLDTPTDTTPDSTVIDSGVDTRPIDSGADTRPIDSGVDTRPIDTGVDTATCDSGVTASCGCVVNHKNCVGGGCAPLGQTYTLSSAAPDNECRARGIPGDPTTYSAAMAVAARDAWTTAGTVSSGTCGGFGSTCVTLGAKGALWVYEGPLAGHVSVNDASTCGGGLCCCVIATDPTWN